MNTSISKKKTLITDDVIVKKYKRDQMRIPYSEVNAADDELSFSAHKLFYYYYSKEQGWTFNDAHIMKRLGYSKRTLGDSRRELIKKQFLHIIKGKVVNYFIGKEAVAEHRARLQEQNCNAVDEKNS